MKSSFIQKYGQWALITGGSAGIGRAYAENLASKGLNLILVARNAEKLEQASAEIKGNYPVEVMPVSADINTEEGIEKVLASVKNLEVGLLINNAGNAFVHSFFDAPEEKLTANLTLNLIAPLKLTYHLGKEMMGRQRGGIIFVSSIAAYQGIGYMANYSAEKAFILMFGESLYFELKKQQIDVMVVSPGTTDTALGRNTEGLDNAKLPLIYMKPGTLVNKSFAKFGKKPSMIPGLLNNITVFIGKHILSRKGNGALWSSIIDKAIVR
jgi:uncharacterized protein